MKCIIEFLEHRVTTIKGEFPAPCDSKTCEVSLTRIALDESACAPAKGPSQ